MIKYCAICRADVPHSIALAGNTQTDRCLACGLTSTVDYDKLREFIREIQNRLERAAAVRDPEAGQ